MARTVLTPAQLPNNGGVSVGAGVVPDHTNGNIVASPGPFKLVIVVANASTAVNLIVRASGYQGTPTGAANSGYVTGQYQPYATASIGDLTVSLAANCGRCSRPSASRRSVSSSACGSWPTSGCARSAL